MVEVYCWTCPWNTLKVAFVLQIATQIAVLIAKVARLDCPRQWPELIPILLESVKVQDSLQQHRALLTFYHVTKTLASKRLATDRRLFQDVSRALMLLTFICYFSSTFPLELSLTVRSVTCCILLFFVQGVILVKYWLMFQLVYVRRKTSQSDVREMKLAQCRRSLGLAWTMVKCAW